MWHEIVELSRPKNVVLAAITVPLGAHLALGDAWTYQAAGLVTLQTTSAICFMAAGNTLNDIADISIDKIKDGIIYDAKRLLLEVKQMVDEKKLEENWELKQPGIK